jgi:choline kinase
MSAGDRPLLVILGAGRPFRGLAPAALAEAGNQMPALDWCLQAFAGQHPETHFVGGYHFYDVVRRYPHLSYSVNLDWATTGSAASLLSVPLDRTRTHYVTYADVVVRAALVDRLAKAQGPVVAVVDRGWRRRRSLRKGLELARLGEARDGLFELRQMGDGVTDANADAQYVGVLKLAPEAIDAVTSVIALEGGSWRRWSLPSLIGALADCGVTVRALDCDGEWASFDTPQEVARFVIGSKADTLERLAPLVRHCRILDSVAFAVGEWRDHPDAVLDRLHRALGTVPLIVRSSAGHEDGWASSHAGRYVSVADVPGGDRDRLSAAIATVVQSYGDGAPDDQVLVQPMLHGTTASGVIMTRTLARGGPYYVFNYEESTASTSGVTSGQSGALETVIVHRSQTPDDVAQGAAPATVQRLLPAIRELETLVGHDALDVEFAVDREGDAVVLQVRPIAADYSAWGASDDRVEKAIRDAADRLSRAQAPPPFQVGRSGAWGLMPDWNPAEVIGERPRPLAFSLYRKLVTDEVWAAQRAAFGYRDVRHAPLVISLGGHPYVDVRASFNSFVPAALPGHLAEALVEIYLERLRRDPALHDKIEFDVALTCATFDFDRRLEQLRADGFPAEGLPALHGALTAITRLAVADTALHTEAIATLEHRRAAIQESGRPPLTIAAAHLSDCARYGTLPFAHLARRAFVATALLRSAVSEGLIDEPRLAAFMRSLNTVTSAIARDTARVAGGELPRADFLRTYGHLRPGTYEITAPSYAAAFPDFVAAPVTHRRDTDAFAWPPEAAARLGKALAAQGLDQDVAAFDAFCRGAIEGRELAKFCFTKSLSLALDRIAEYGATAGLSRDDLAHLEWGDLESAAVGAIDAEELAARAARGREWHTVAQAVELPPLIFAPGDLWRFRLPASRPNFIGTGSVVAPLVRIGEIPRARGAARGAIVLLDQADPGYDWLFADGIAGLVTVFGGANSHMAVRAAELGLPAAIGIGPVLNERLRSCRTLLLDCGAFRLESLA